MRVLSRLLVVLLLCASTLGAIPSLINSLEKALEAGKAGQRASHATKALAASRMGLVGPQSLARLKAGDVDGSLQGFKEFAQRLRDQGTAESVRDARTIEIWMMKVRLAQLKEARRRNCAALGDQCVTPAAEVIATEEPLISLLGKVPYHRQKIIRSIESSTKSKFEYELRDADVRKFLIQHKAGFANPQRYLNAARASHAQLVSAWLAAPIERRIFAIGAGKDAAFISRMHSTLERDGYRPFFYDFARSASGVLLPSEAIGALLATSGHTMVVDTQAARASKFVGVEQENATRLLKGEASIVLLTPSDVIEWQEGEQLPTMHARVELAVHLAALNDSLQRYAMPAP